MNVILTNALSTVSSGLTTQPIKTTIRFPVPMNFDEAKIIHMDMPLSYYNITADNGTFQLLEALNTLTITMTPGSYTAAEFCTMLKTQLDAATMAAEVYTVSIDGTTGFITVATVATNIGFQLASYKKAARVLGMLAINVAATATSVSGTLPVQLKKNRIYLNSEFLTKSYPTFLNESQGYTIMSIPITESSFGIMSVDFVEPFELSHNVKSSVIDVYFTDEFGDNIDWNGGVWSIHLIVNKV